MRERPFHAGGRASRRRFRRGESGRRYNRRPTWFFGCPPVKKLIALAVASIVLTACSSAEKEQQKERTFLLSQQSLDTAQRNATIACRDAAQCDAAWKLTKTYVEQNSKERLTRADDAAIETDVPSGSGKPVFSATRIASGNGATISLFAQCKGMFGDERARGSDFDDCATKIIAVQNGFAPYLRAHMPAQ
ncbi:hypothetical protein AWB80_04226 [Caballeronia pedi]|uniref:Uncharacterized protein n=1 Tax=Caballeronia pedi TaxID=1777141 RepID=A0A158BWC9_9BURK|nr:hypothetical protein AWB80_04226 [Caballeronia pedi]